MSRDRFTNVILPAGALLVPVVTGTVVGILTKNFDAGVASGSVAAMSEIPVTAIVLKIPSIAQKIRRNR